MNKKITICIYTGPLSTPGRIPTWDGKDVDKGIVGGSETWAIEIARAFAKKGFNVTLIGYHPFQIDSYGINYIPIDIFYKTWRNYKFDITIMSRYFDDLNLINTDTVYGILHDISIISNANVDSHLMAYLNKVSKFAVLSDWHKNHLLNFMQGSLREDRIMITANGVHTELYDNVDYSKKKNMMVWSSRAERNLPDFLRYIYPKIKKAVPDFTLKVCSYNKIKYEPLEELYKQDGVEFLGQLSKSELAELQKESKIWVYPNNGWQEFIKEMSPFRLFHETFCISAVENALAENAIVCFDLGGIRTTLAEYDHFIHVDINNDCVSIDDNIKNDNFLFDENIKEELVQEYYQKMVDMSIDLLNNPDKCKEIGQSLKAIGMEYTWSNIANNWIREWELNFTEK